MNRSMVEASLANLSKDPPQGVSPHIDSTMRRTHAFQLFGAPPSIGTQLPSLRPRKFHVPVTYAALLNLRKQN